jgi:hypothetical protein
MMVRPSKVIDPATKSAVLAVAGVTGASGVRILLQVIAA